MAPKRAFGGVLRPFGGGFRGPNRERASVFSSAGRGAERGSSAVQEGRGRGGLRCGTGGPTCSAVESGALKKHRSVHFYFCYTTLLLYGLLLRDARPIHPAARQRLRTPGARLFCGRLPAACSPATACLPSISVCPSVGVTAVKASAIRSLSRSAARRSGLSRLAAGISAVRVAPVKAAAARVVPVKAAAHRPGPSTQPPGVTVLSRPGSRPSAARNLPSLLLAPSAAGVTAPPRQYGRPPATGESPASSLRRASPARDSTAYRPAP